MALGVRLPRAMIRVCGVWWGAVCLFMTRDWRNGPPSQMRLFPLSARFSQGGEIGRPFFGLIAAKFVEIIPAVEPGVVTIVENNPCRIISHGFHRDDLNMT